MVGWLLFNKGKIAKLLAYTANKLTQSGVQRAEPMSTNQEDYTTMRELGHESFLRMPRGTRGQ